MSTRLLSICILIILCAKGAIADYIDPTSRTNINRQTDFFEKSIDDLKGLERQLEADKAAAMRDLEGTPKALEFLSDKSKSEIEASANELDSIRADDLADKGRAKLIESNLLEEIYFDETAPLYRQHKKDADAIAEASGKLLGNLLGMLKDLGVDCKTVKGNKVVEPEYFIDLKREQTKNTVYNKTICEELRNKYNCRDILTMHCSKKSTLEFKHIDVLWSETPGHWWNELNYTEGNLSLKNNKEAMSIWYHTIINSPEVHAQVQAEIIKRTGTDKKITIPEQDIVLHTLGRDIVSLPLKNVVDRGELKTTFGIRRYSRDKAIIRFHYYLGTKDECVEWQEGWEERCNLQ